MVLLHSPEKDAAFTMPDFKLKNIDGAMISGQDCAKENGLLVMFICNHCPYVLAIVDRITKTCQALQEKGIGCVAIMSNDAEAYPADSFENMALFAQKNGFTFPYLIDETQEIAKAFDAVCTPEFFGFDAQGTLQYRGRLDSAGPNAADENTVAELYDAMLAVKETGTSSAAQYSSMGCSIKWRED